MTKTDRDMRQCIERESRTSFSGRSATISTHRMKNPDISGVASSATPERRATSQSSQVEGQDCRAVAPRRCLDCSNLEGCHQEGKIGGPTAHRQKIAIPGEWFPTTLDDVSGPSSRRHGARMCSSTNLYRHNRVREVAGSWGRTLPRSSCTCRGAARTPRSAGTWPYGLVCARGYKRIEIFRRCRPSDRGSTRPAGSRTPRRSRRRNPHRPGGSGR